MSDTIFALSSGAPPAAIGVIRISGPDAGKALRSLTGSLPEPRRASLRTVRSSDGDVLDQALVLWFPGPRTATGEDLFEMHCHGGRAVVRALETELWRIEGLRQAEPGEFTRRAFANGVIDLVEAEGLGDLLTAETELQRQAAQTAYGGSLSRQLEAWRDRVLHLSAMVEAVLDFGDEDDVETLPPDLFDRIAMLKQEWRDVIDAPQAERLKEGVRVALAGPPNAGKSSLFNALLDEGAAIVSEEAGTTRDAIERPVSFEGIPFVLVDTAGLRSEGAGAVERIGIQRAEAEMERADIVLWLGDEGGGIDGAWEVDPKRDLEGKGKVNPRHSVSSVTGEGIAELWADLARSASSLLPKPNSTALNQRQMGALRQALNSLPGNPYADPLILAEHLRTARYALDRLQGRHSTEDMLDSLFGRFCIGK